MDTYDIIKTILLIIHGKITLNVILDLEANYYVFAPYRMQLRITAGQTDNWNVMLITLSM
jgi:hypothetical protein